MMNLILYCYGDINNVEKRHIYNISAIILED